MMPTNYAYKKVKRKHEEFYYELQEYGGVPFYLREGSYEGKRAMCFVIPSYEILFWIPKRHLTKQGRLKSGQNIDYVFKGKEESLLMHGIVFEPNSFQKNTSPGESLQGRFFKTKKDGKVHILNHLRTRSLCNQEIVVPNIDEQSGYTIGKACTYIPVKKKPTVKHRCPSCFKKVEPSR